MSEKIVQLNEEVRSYQGGQLKELVRGGVEETLNELLEAEAEKLTQATSVTSNVRDTEAATTAETSPPPLEISHSRYPSLREYPLRPLLLNGTAAAKAT